MIFEPVHNKTYKRLVRPVRTDQPAHLPSLIRVLAGSMCLLQSPGYPKREKRKILPYWVEVQADLSFCWSHKSYCRFCHLLAHFVILHRKYALHFMGDNLHNLSNQFTGENKKNISRCRVLNFCYLACRVKMS